MVIDILYMHYIVYWGHSGYLNPGGEGGRVERMGSRSLGLRAERELLGKGRELWCGECIGLGRGFGKCGACMLWKLPKLKLSIVLSGLELLMMELNRPVLLRELGLGRFNCGKLGGGNVLLLLFSLLVLLLLLLWLWLNALGSPPKLKVSAREALMRFSMWLTEDEELEDGELTLWANCAMLGLMTKVGPLPSSPGWVVKYFSNSFITSWRVPKETRLGMIAVITVGLVILFDN